MSGERERGSGEPRPAALTASLAGTDLPLLLPPFSTPFLCADEKACEGLHCPPMDPLRMDPEPECLTRTKSWGVMGQTPPLLGHLFQSPHQKNALSCPAVCAQLQ